jgi:xyloglucan-specific exo-beta-1,4-glucanase
VHLLSGVGDVDGFRHDDLSVSPEQGSFEGPRLSNTEDLAFAGRKPEVMVRVGTSRNQVPPAAISRDGGVSWTALGGEPAPRSAAGSVTISADGDTIVWTPRRGRASYSVTSGTTWALCAGLQSGARVVADRVNPDRLYSYDPSADRCLASAHGAGRFATVSASAVAGMTSSGREPWRDGSLLYATPDFEGDLWLALRDRGLFHSDDGGVHFTRLGEVERAVSLGFGKPAAGQNYPALFLAGRIHSTSGLFRSDDGGRSWIRINDDAHQFGWVDHVTGDSRIFGRVYFGTGGRGIIWGEPAP